MRVNVWRVNMKPLSYENASLDDTWDAIVVGSGIGGLAAAALLSHYAGKRVLVLERHYVPGGYTHVFHRPGYEWDVGLHYIGELEEETSLLRRAFAVLSDEQLAWAPMPEVYDRFVIGDQTYQFAAGVDQFRTGLKEYFPRESVGIDQYIRALQSVARVRDLYFAEKAIPRSIAFLIGGWMRMPLLRWARRTTEEVLNTFTQNQELIGLLTAQWGDYGLPPRQSSFALHAIIAAHYLEGASYPIGGAGRIAKTIAPLIRRNGGNVVVNAEVAQVLMEKNRAVGVRMSDGRELRAQIVISDAGASNTFGRLVPQDDTACKSLVAKIRTIPPSTAHLCLYLGVKESAASLGIDGTNIWVHQTYDHDKNLATFLDDPTGPLPSVYLSFPSAKDPDFERRHPGRATIEAISLIPYRLFTGWQDTKWRRRGPEYDNLKQSFTVRLQEELVRQVPRLAGKIDHAELSTPLSTRHFMNYQQGEMYGLSGTTERFKLRCLTPHTPICNLYLTGQDVASLGVSGALVGGILTASAILGRNLIAELAKTQPTRVAGSGFELRDPVPTANCK